ncbi:MAG TPA: hypothetical protein VHJ82_04325, partial [Actinomycetota bacterium]|nr:hypothetical protein [Actinomycetota bacterium]
MSQRLERSEAEGSELARVLTRERKMTLIRWAGVAFGVLQVETYYIPHPPGTETIALSIVALLAIGNVMLSLFLRGVRDLAAARRLSMVSLLLDFLAVMGFVFVYTFDQDTAIWALIYILPMEGALRFELRGALWTMGAAAVLYSVREVYGHQAFGNDLLLTSISFRMGIGFIIGAVAGVASSQLVRERLQAEAETKLREEALAKLA